MRYWTNNMCKVRGLTVPFNLVCHACHSHASLLSQLNRNVGSVPSLEPCMVPSGTWKLVFRESFNVSSYCWNFGPVFEVHGVFNHRDSPSTSGGGQPRPIAITYNDLRVSYTILTNNFKEVLCLVCVYYGIMSIIGKI